MWQCTITFTIGPGHLNEMKVPVSPMKDMHVHTVQQTFANCLFEVTNTLLCSTDLADILSVTVIHRTLSMSYAMCFAYKWVFVAKMQG